MRSSGILLHITSLSSPYGIGDLGPCSRHFVDFLRSSAQRYWQVLPINPTDGINGHSPYSCFSAFAGNPLLISPDDMVKDGFLLAREIRPQGVLQSSNVDFIHAQEYKHKLFILAYEHFLAQQDHREFDEFCVGEKDWLSDYALFIAAKFVYKGKSWIDWPLPLRTRSKNALKLFAKKNSRLIEEAKFIQFLFFKQWHRLRAYAHHARVRIIGDIPIYVNYDSADVWCHPHLFKLDGKGHLKFVSGCPPDYFSKTGQRWGNPVYDWARLKRTKYSWWIKRVEHNLKLFDSLRIDHFRGFAAFWQIPAHEKLSVFGRWVKGPGRDFFKVLMTKFKGLPLIAEDLGEITPDVLSLMREFQLPGMRVLLFAFGGDVKTNPHVPANYQVNSVVYTGTHDNNTVRGWFQHEAKPQEKVNCWRVLGKTLKPSQLPWAMIEILMRSKANTVIIPLSDVLGKGAEARMNTPATKVNNWRWRFEQKELTMVLAKKLRSLTRKCRRE